MIELVKQHPIQAAIVMYFLIISVVIIMQPIVIFSKNGTPRDFGVGDSNRTIYPLWLICILTAILSYYTVLIWISLNP